VERGEIEETGEYDLEGLFVRLDYAIRTVGAKRVVLDTIESLFAGLKNDGILRSETGAAVPLAEGSGRHRGDHRGTRRGLPSATCRTVHACFLGSISCVLLSAWSKAMIKNETDQHEQTEALQVRLAEAEDMLRAIRHGEIDALVVEGAGGNQVYTLHSADEPCRNLVEQMQEGAVVLTLGGDILYANARFAALVGEPLESVVGSRVDRFVNASDRDDFEILLRAGSGRRRSSLIGQDSGAFEVSLSLTTTASTTGDRLNLIVTDLRELLAANNNRERAERDSRSKDEFLAMLAHELRNPLGAISTAVSVLALTHAEGEAATRAQEVIARQVGQISHLINDLLDAERVVSGKIRLNRQPLDMAEAVRRAVATFAGDVRLDRHIDIGPEPVWINADPVRLEQVLTNILINAVKYTPAGGQIRVAVRTDGNDAVLSVEDTGFGISPEVMPFIFDMYVQADRTLDRAQGGLGIGLPLVRRLVELHGGTVVASSAGEGHGTTFTLRLKRMPPARTSAHTSFPPSRCSKPRRVLLVEDSGDAREMLRMTLQLAGHVVYDASDGVQGLELLNVVRPDVGIIDISLPGMDGYQLAKRIREEPNGRGMLLLAMTGYSAPGYSAPGDADRSLEHGFDYHLVKPVDLDHIARLLGENTGALQGISA
jgi:signal transduction histidine kinase/ActR/RegA family two-component response regulator